LLLRSVASVDDEVASPWIRLGSQCQKRRPRLDRKIAKRRVPASDRSAPKADDAKLFS
jgi:hypothetical protein